MNGNVKKMLQYVFRDSISVRYKILVVLTSLLPNIGNMHNGFNGFVHILHTDKF